VKGQKLPWMDSYKGKSSMHCDKIYPIMDERSRTFMIEAHFVKPPEKTILIFEANIVIRTKDNAITVQNLFDR
jgi:hypothetical protein